MDSLGVAQLATRTPDQLSAGMRCSLAGFILASVFAALEIGSGTYAQFRSFALEDPFFSASIGGVSFSIVGSIDWTVRGWQKDTSSMESASPLDRSATAMDRASDG